MEPKFPDWYAICNPTANAELIEKRWAGVTENAAGTTFSEVPDIVRLAFGIKPDVEAVEATLRTRFQEQDASFRMSGNTPELQLLASAVLHQIIQTTTRSADLATLASVCIGFRPLDVRPPDDVLARLKGYAESRATSLRTRKRLQRISAPSLEFKEELQAIAAVAPNQASQFAAPVTTVLEKVAQRLRTFGQQVQGALDSHQQHFATQDEELAMLWWLFSGHSSDADVAFRGLKAGERALRASTELADRTRHPLGPPAILGFLDRAVNPSGDEDEPSCSLREAIESLPKEWRNERSGEGAEYVSRMPDLCPISFSITRSLEDGWSTSIGSAIGLDAEQDRRAVHLAAQYYHELLLLRLMKSESGS